jgi:hypothetical protein
VAVSQISVAVLLICSLSEISWELGKEEIEILSILILTCVGDTGEKQRRLNDRCIFHLNLTCYTLHYILVRTLTCTYILIQFVALDHLFHLPDSSQTIPRSRYLAAMSLFTSSMLTFLFSLCFPHSHCLTLMTSSILITICVSHPLCYLLILSTMYQVP